MAERASHTCEYCLLPQKASFFVFQIEHVISKKHGGSNDIQNLAYSCPICNRNKGTDLGTLSGNPPILTRFFHPRNDIWLHHFSLDTSGEFLPKTEVGSATIMALDMNNIESIIDRKKLIQAGEMKPI
ncbi:MAG: HNH endonuclease [Bacteroidales bacterium]|nr:HNH endonuclease [Bacteroidales bacterium]